MKTIESIETWEGTEQLRLLLSVFRDGSGQEKDSDGTRAGWRDIERVVAEYFEGFATEAKHVYDVFLNRNNEVCGISVKSKCLGKNEKIESLDKVGRVYMELTNSPALLWSPIKEIGITENQFGQEHLAQTIGDSILDTVESWYDEAEISAEISRNIPGLSSIDSYSVHPQNGCHLVLSYGKPSADEERLYQFHAFALSFPKDIRWTFHTKRCLRGFDPLEPDKPLLDWYGLSGGQLKYYPLARTAWAKSQVFSLEQPEISSISSLSRKYWPSQWERLRFKH